MLCFRELEADIKEDFLVRIGQAFGVDQSEASHLYSLLLQCMDHRQSVSENDAIIYYYLVSKLHLYLHYCIMFNR